MRSAPRSITIREREEVARAIKEAEAATSAEIVPVVATTSGRYDRAEDLVGLLFSLLGLTAAWLLVQWSRPLAGMWATRTDANLPLGLLVVIVLGGFLLGTLAANWFPSLRRLFLAEAHMKAEVERAAHAAFATLGVRRTEGATGVLIYISLAERRVRILGDTQISECLCQADWDAVRDLVIDGLRAGRLVGGLLAGIRKAGALLAIHFPATGQDPNPDEIGNQLHLLD